jgi:hydrogenase nickel incorporation protein HypA/HybF
MHELSLMEAVLDKALAVAEEAGAERVVRIEVEVGALCGIVPGAWEMAFEAATPGTPLEGARMDWRIVPAQVRCPACAHEYPPEDIIWECPSCGAYGGEVVRGDDIVLLRIEAAGGPGVDPETGAVHHGD